ncbi:MAG: heterodisulfide reductase-related iron-sulfur binding cluster [Nocardioides sp.]|nr:heterodisulfide reductase-related iron-sulfur binding cluster [Nocardioides sp.]
MSAFQIVAIVIALGTTAVAVALTARAVASMVATIRMGQPALKRSDDPARRTVTMLKETFGHTRMFQWRWVGIMHWFVYFAFLFLASAVLAGYFQLFNPEFALPLIGHWFGYEWIAEAIGLLSTIGIVALIIYRQKNHPRSQGRKSRFYGSNFWQAYFVEAMVLLEGSAILFIRGAEYRLGALVSDDPERFARSHFPISGFVGDGLFGGLGVEGLETAIIAIALVKILAAMIWLIVIASNLTMGVAWHRFTAWPNIWFKRESGGGTALGAIKPLTSDGKAITLDDIDDLDEDSTLGVGSIEDFSWKGILDFTTCTECGRCQSQCPAWNTEKPLSPKLLIMGLRDHAYAKAPYLQAGGEGSEAATALLEGDENLAREAQRPLVGDTGDDWFYMPDSGAAVIDPEVLWNCTSCGACVQQCPVDIEHVDHIMDMRRYQVLVESNFPTELNQLFKGLENKGNPWNMSANARMDWAKDLPFEVKVVGDDVEDLDEVEWLFWVGCAGAYEDRAKKTTRAVAELLDMAGVSFAVLGKGETCTGDPARRAGNEFVFQGLAQQNAEVLTETKAKKVVSTCAHCFNTLKNEYATFGVELEVVHHTQLLNRLVREGKLTPVKTNGAAKRTVTYHDPCYLGRHNQVYTPPRDLLTIIPDAEFTEMPRNSERSFCCGAGGARMWMEENTGERININRTKEAVETGADQIAVGCPFCRVMLSDGLTMQQSKGEAREEVEVLDVAQMLLASIKGETAAPAKAKAKVGAGAGATAKAASTETKAEPDAGDTTQTEETVTKTEDVGPLAKASGGSSLFDDEPEETKPAASSGGSSLFDDEPEVAVTGADNEQDVAPADEKPESSVSGGGSLFDVADEAPAAKAEPAPKPEVTDTGADNEQDVAPAEEKPESSITDGGSLFDIPTDEPAPKAAPKAETTKDEPEATVTESSDIPSLHDVKAKAAGGTTKPEADQAEAAPEAPEAKDEAPAEEPKEKPAPPAAPPASSGKGIDEADSLFDL